MAEETVDVVLTSYYSGKIDPQNHVFVEEDSFNYILPWYATMTERQMYGLIFHDHLSDKFVEKYSTPKIQFIKVDSSAYNVSIIDFRFLAYRDFLTEHYFNRILLSDVSDVMFLKNPFELMTDPEKIYIGSETRKINQSEYCRELFVKIYPQFKYWDNTILNAGLIGGSHKIMMEYLEHFAEEEKNNRQPDDIPQDMAVFNHVIYTYFNDRYVTGHPLHTEFGKGDVHNPEAYVVHK